MDFSTVGSVSASTTQTSSSSASSRSDDAAFQELVAYFFESPAERILDNWLRAHGMTREDFENKSPEEQDTIRKQIADEIKKKTEQRAETTASIGAA